MKKLSKLAASKIDYFQPGFKPELYNLKVDDGYFGKLTIGEEGTPRLYTWEISWPDTKVSLTNLEKAFTEVSGHLTQRKFRIDISQDSQLRRGISLSLIQLEHNKQKNRLVDTGCFFNLSNAMQYKNYKRFIKHLYHPENVHLYELGFAGSRSLPLPEEFVDFRLKVAGNYTTYSQGNAENWTGGVASTNKFPPTREILGWIIQNHKDAKLIENVNLDNAAKTLKEIIGQFDFRNAEENHDNYDDFLKNLD